MTLIVNNKECKELGLNSNGDRETAIMQKTQIKNLLTLYYHHLPLKLCSSGQAFEKALKFASESSFEDCAHFGRLPIVTVISSCVIRELMSIILKEIEEDGYLCKFSKHVFEFISYASTGNKYNSDDIKNTLHDSLQIKNSVIVNLMKEVKMSILMNKRPPDKILINSKVQRSIDGIEEFQRIICNRLNFDEPLKSQSAIDFYEKHIKLKMNSFKNDKNRLAQEFKDKFEEIYESKFDPKKIPKLMKYILEEHAKVNKVINVDKEELQKALNTTYKNVLLRDTFGKEAADEFKNFTLDEVPYDQLIEQGELGYICAFCHHNSTAIQGDGDDAYFTYYL